MKKDMPKYPEYGDFHYCERECRNHGTEKGDYWTPDYEHYACEYGGCPCAETAYEWDCEHYPEEYYEEEE